MACDVVASGIDDLVCCLSEVADIRLEVMNQGNGMLTGFPINRQAGANNPNSDIAARLNKIDV